MMKASMQTSVAVAALLWAAPGFGQAAVPQTVPEANSPQGAAVSPVTPNGAGTGLEEIVVTAQRIAESSQRAALAIDVLKPEELTRQFVTRAEDLSRASPALAATGGAGGTTAFFVRGVGNATVNGYSDPAIAFNYDGVYIGRPSSTSGVFYDLQRVEVLKGPQGTLYGRNATGGAINVIPNRPRLGEDTGEATVSYGNFDWITAQGAINAAVGDQVAVRLAGNLSRHDAFLTDGTGSQREYGGRFQVYAEPGDGLDLRIGADYAHQGGASGSGVYLGAVNPTFGATGFSGYSFSPTGFSRQQGVGDPASQQLLASRFIAQTGRAGAVIDGTPFNDNDYWGVTGELNYKTDAGTLTIQPAYRESHLDYAFTGIFRDAGTKEDDSQTSVEARWAGQITPAVDYLIGGMYFDEQIKGTARYNQFTLTPYQTFDTGTESWAGFGRLTVRPVERLSLTAAGRYTSDRKTFDGTSNVYILFCGNPAPPQDLCPNLPLAPLTNSEAGLQSFYGSRGVPITPVPLYVLPPQAGGSQTAPFVLRSPIVIDAALKNKKFTYRLAAQYDLAPRSMLYASFETGYHAGGFSFARGIETYAPESIKAYTIGSKNRFFDNRLQVNLEGFVWKYKNQQFSQFGFDLGNPPSTVLLTRNIGNSTIKGFDLDTELLVTETTLLSANVQYLDTNYDSFVYFAPNQGLPPNTTCGYAPTTQTTPGGATLSVFRVDCSGRQAFNSPKWSLNLNGQQTIPIGSTKLVLQAGTRYRGDTYSSSDYLPYLRGRANFVSNASVTLSAEDDSWFASLYVFNIEDSQRLTTATVNSGGLFVANAEQPRTYGLRIGTKF
jgi:iron complex outermembrane receptor protein